MRALIGVGGYLLPDHNYIITRNGSNRWEGLEIPVEQKYFYYPKGEERLGIDARNRVTTSHIYVHIRFISIPAIKH
jgi:hypothetical protein